LAGGGKGMWTDFIILLAWFVGLLVLVVWKFRLKE
jgi:hypothetical protein